MADFLNFDRHLSYYRPYESHLDVFISFKKVDLKLMAYAGWNYKVKVFCSVPIILFQCKCDGCNILMHLNMPAMEKVKATSWLKAEKLTFLLFISDASCSKHVVWAKNIQLSKADSDKIRSACYHQRTLSYNQVENLVDPIYHLEIDNIWPGN